MAIRWKVEKRKIKDLKVLKKNPRQLSKDMREHLETSLSKFGICDLPVINTDNTIIGGHQRLKVLKHMGTKEISVLVPEDELTNDQVEELNIRLNKNTGEWDWDKLANEWDIADLVSWGFSLDELDIDMPEDEDEGQGQKEKEPKKCPHCGEVLD